MTENKRPVELLATTRHRIVGMTNFQGMLILATDNGVYRYHNNQFIPIRFSDDPTTPRDLTPA
jgi:hypothetical protein